jgi:FAD/FMN-containing dehydrogenase
MPMPAIDALLRDLDDLAVETQPQRVRRRSRDFYWYSPILKRQLDHVTADAVVTPRDEAEVLRVMRACWRHRVPLTARGGGTGNYGQAMPLKGGIVMDLSEMTAIKAIGLGRVRVEAGAKLCDIDAACQAHALRQELRIHPSTHKTGTIGGYVAGGSSGVGSITWGLLRDRGNIIAARVLTMEEEPRILELRGDAIQQVNHAYGTNGIITELEMPLVPAHRWRELILAFDDFMTAVRFADALAHEDALLKKLLTPIAAPIGQQYLRPELLGPDDHCVMLMIAEIALEVFRDMAAGWPCRIVWDVCMDELPKAQPPLFEYTWNHTTLNALKLDRGITYLQTLFPPPGHVGLVERMYQRFGDEVPVHLEFVRFGGEVACFGLQLVRYTTDERLLEIIDDHNDNGCPIFNPHDHTLEGGGMKKVDQGQLAFKRAADPLNLLNPGKMIGWDDPAYDESQDRTFLYEWR